MQSRLEDVLREKERELKLHDKYLGLVRFCEQEVFPYSPIPIETHVQSLKAFIEKLIPEPKHRREELFSGEVFILLCMLYFHDMGTTTRWAFSENREILGSMDPAARTFILNGEIGRRLDIPDKAVELINSLIFSIKKIPIEWEIAEGPTKAIVRNAPMLGGIFDFAHLMWDIFSADASYRVLRRRQGGGILPDCGDAALAVDSREGIISITCRPRLPYQAHLVARVRDDVERLFNRFKDAVNGRLGFQYKQIVWDVADFSDLSHVPDVPGHFPFTALHGLPYIRWEEASRLLDRLFRYGHVIVVGDGTTGKTTMINSFVTPQLRHLSTNVFYTELWERPVHEIRQSIERVRGTLPGDSVDIVSTCKKLLMDGPCFFIIDGCERLKTMPAEEGEKLERFIRFCLNHENAYLIALGDKEEFFAWYEWFASISLSAIFEIAPIVRPEADLSYRSGEIGPIGILKEKVDEVIGSVPDPRELREVIFVLTGNGEKTLRRYTVDDIRFETCIPADNIARCLGLLHEKGIVRSQEGLATTFWALSSRHLREHLHRHLQLDEFLYKRRMREALRAAAEEGRFLDQETLDGIDDLRHRMMFSKKEMGLILGSTVYHGRDWTDLLAIAEKETNGFEGEYALSLLAHEDPRIREAALRLLTGAMDDGFMNPLLAHLRRETDARLRMLLVEGFVATGKRRTIVALMNGLTEMADRDAKLKVIDDIYRRTDRTARDLLIEIADVEKDPEVIDRIDYWLLRLEE